MHFDDVMQLHTTTSGKWEKKSALKVAVGGDLHFQITLVTCG